MTDGMKYEDIRPSHWRRLRQVRALKDYTEDRVRRTNVFNLLHRVRQLEKQMEHPFIHRSGLSDYIEHIANFTDLDEAPVKTRKKGKK